MPATQPSTSAPAPASAPSRAIAHLNPTLVAIAVDIRNRNTDLARVKLEGYLLEYPNDAPAIFLEGLSYHREQKYGQALPYYNESLRLDPEFTVTLHFKGWALYYLGELEESRATFESFLAHHPDDYDSYFALGLIALDEDKIDEAERQFNHSLDLLRARGGQADRKAVSKARTRLSEVYERRGDLEAAAHELELAVMVYPDHYEASYRLSRVLKKLGRTEEAQNAYEEYLVTRERLHPGTSFPE